jgi:indolepyruvate ferredoxin oxidoreductase beta subunit
METITNILLSGVGGQGIILASDLAAEAAMAAGNDVKKSEVHGMAQRGGSVVTHLRFGPRVRSPLIPEGEADILVAFEEMEALRYLHLLKRGGTLILNRQRILPLAVLSGKAGYPDAALDSLDSLPLRLVRVDGLGLAARAGNERTVNVAVTGVLSSFLPFGPELWREALQRLVPPRFREVNLEAFRLGRESLAAG